MRHAKTLAVLLVAAMSAAGAVVVPADTTPFSVAKDDTVRIAVPGIAGTTVTATVAGPAKATVTAVRSVRNGRPVIGPRDHEVSVVPTGTGKVTVTIAVKSRSGKATELKYEFTIQE